MTRVLFLLTVAAFTLTACDDPQENAYKVNRFFGFWSLLVLAGLVLTVGAVIAYRARKAISPAN